MYGVKEGAICGGLQTEYNPKYTVLLRVEFRAHARF